MPTHPPTVAVYRGGLDQWMGSAKTAEPIQMPFRKLTHAGSRNNVWVQWAHCRNLVNTTEPSAVPAESLYRGPTGNSPYIGLCNSAYPFIPSDALECHIKFPIKVPCDAAFCQNSLTSCYIVLYLVYDFIIIIKQELIRRWDSERELLRSAPGSYSNSLK